MNAIKQVQKLIRMITGFFGGVLSELRLTEWVKGSELLRYTGIVVFYALFLTTFIYFADAVLVALRSGILGSTSL